MTVVARGRETQSTAARRRERELGELEAAWEAVADGLPRVCLLTGEAGIGKSRLVAELAQQVAADGAPVLYGACQESPRPSYGPFADAISLDLRGLDLDAAGHRLGTSAGELSRIVPDLRDRFGPAAHVSGENPAGGCSVPCRARRPLSAAAGPSWCVGG